MKMEVITSASLSPLHRQYQADPWPQAAPSCLPLLLCLSDSVLLIRIAASTRNHDRTQQLFASALGV